MLIFIIKVIKYLYVILALILGCLLIFIQALYVHTLYRLVYFIIKSMLKNPTIKKDKVKKLVNIGDLFKLFTELLDKAIRICLNQARTLSIPKR